MTADFNRRPSVLVLYDQPHRFMDALRGRFPKVRFEFCEEPSSLDEMLAQAKPRIVFGTKCPKIPGPAHRPAIAWESVAWFQNGGVGIDHLKPWDAARVTVTNCAGILAPFLAETVLGAMIQLNFGFHRYRDQQKERRWQQLSWRSLAGRTVLIVGLGNIGRQVARKAKEQGMRVTCIRQGTQKPPDVDELRPISHLRECLAEADFVTLPVPLTEKTHHLIDREALAAMRPEAFLINTARGPVVDEAALIEALKTNRIAGAYLDVFESEPLPPGSPLWGFENVILTPHASDLVEDWDIRFAHFFAENLANWLAGRPLKNIVDPRRGY